MELKEAAEAYHGVWKSFVEVRLFALSATEKVLQESRMVNVVNACERYRASLSKYPNVVGVGASLKIKGNEVMNLPCLVVYVRNKIKPKEQLGINAIPSQIEGAPTDVVEAGTPGLRHFIGPIHPLQPGYSIGHVRITSGTLGCLVRDRRTKDILMLSNNHIFANSNSASIGDPIVHPGPYYGGSDPKDTVARLGRFERIFPGTNTVDAAVARPAVSVKPDIPQIGIPTGVGRVNRVGINVEKAGSTTQVTRGYVVAYNASIFPLYYPGIGNVEFAQQIVTTGMSKGGDSGSLLVSRVDKMAFGLLFAGIGDPQGTLDVVTYFNDINNVQTKLDVDVLTS